MKTDVFIPPAYSLIQDVNHITAQVPQDDLVAVFTLNNGGGGLLVYNVESAPTLPDAVEQAGWHARTLYGLHPGDYTRYDGPVISIATIDVLLDDIPTHGVHFFPLEDLPVFRESTAAGVFARTTNRLVKMVNDDWQALPADEQIRQRPVYCKRVIQLCLPSALQKYGGDPDLVGLRVDLSDLDCPPLAMDMIRPIYNRPGEPDDILSLSSLTEGEWVAGLREIRLLVPNLKQHAAHLLSFRPALRRFLGGEFVANSCRQFARRLWQENDRLKQDELRCSAYSLAAEAWLEERDTTDLVAIFPLGGFQEFVEKGLALAVSRGPTGPNPHNWCSLESILHGETSMPNGPVFAVQPLGSSLSRRKKRDVFDLGPVLWQSGHYAELARTLWLLSRDLLQPPNEIWRQLKVSTDEIAEMAQRAALIYSLGNPWAWRQGRFTLLMSECYTHLDRCLQQRERETRGQAQAFYYTALRAWYACAQSDDVVGNTIRVSEYCRSFNMACAEQMLAKDLAHEIEVAGKLEEFTRKVLRPDNFEASSLDMVAVSVGELLFQITQGHTKIPLPSSLGHYWLEEFVTNHRRLHTVRTMSSEERPDPDELKHLREEVFKWRRRAFAPQHELRVLLAALEDEDEQIRRMLTAVGEGVIIKLRALTSEISLEERHTLVIEVRNVGSQVAQDFMLTLERYTGLSELVPGSTIGERKNLEPGDWQRIEIQVRAIEPTVALIFGYRFRDDDGRIQAGEERMYLTARSQTRGVRSRINPFEVGRPVFGKERFFGRRDEIVKILTRLAKGDSHPLALRGPRRIGKSSLLRRIAALLEQPAEIGELGLSPDIQAMLRNLHPITASLQSVDLSRPQTLEIFLGDLLRNICLKLALDTELFDQRFQQRASGAALVTTAFHDQIAEVFQVRPDERIVVLLDELDEVFRASNVELRFLIEHEARISWIAASTMLIHASLGKYGSAFFNLFEVIELRAMDWSSAFQLLRQSGNLAGFGWGEEAITAVLELSGRRPYLIQLLGARVTDNLNLTGQSNVTGEDVAVAASDLLQEIGLTGSYLGFVWNEAGWLGKLILWEVIHADRPLSDIQLAQRIRRLAKVERVELNAELFDAALKERIYWLKDIADTLMETRPLQVNSRGRFYAVSIPLVHRWLKQLLEGESDFVQRAVRHIAEEL